MTTLTELLIALIYIKDQLNSTNIPVLVDGKEILDVKLTFNSKSDLKVKITTKNE